MHEGASRISGEGHFVLSAQRIHLERFIEWWIKVDVSRAVYNQLERIFFGKMTIVFIA